MVAERLIVLRIWVSWSRPSKGLGSPFVDCCGVPAIGSMPGSSSSSTWIVDGDMCAIVYRAVASRIGGPRMDLSSGSADCACSSKAIVVPAGRTSRLDAVPSACHGVRQRRLRATLETAEQLGFLRLEPLARDNPRVPQLAESLQLLDWLRRESRGGAVGGGAAGAGALNRYRMSNVWLKFRRGRRVIPGLALNRGVSTLPPPNAPMAASS